MGSEMCIRDSVKLTFPWTAQGSIQDGQTMTIAFPNEIALPGSNDAIPFSVGGNKAGECRVDADAQALNCRFNDSLSRLDAVSGSISLNVGLKEAPGPNWEFETEPGTSPLSLAIPGGSVAKYVLPAGKENIFSKYGNIEYNENPRSIDWTIILPSESFVDNDNPANEVVITDKLTSANHDYVKPDGAFVAYVYQQNPDLSAEVWPNADVTLTDDERGFTATVTPPAGGWKPGWDLKVSYKTEYNGEGYPSDAEGFNNGAQARISDSAGNVQTDVATDRNLENHTYDSASACLLYTSDAADE